MARVTATAPANPRHCHMTAPNHARTRSPEQAKHYAGLAEDLQLDPNRSLDCLSEDSPDAKGVPTYKGQLVDTRTVNTPPNLPEFLSSGQTYTAVVDFDQLRNQATASENVNLQSSCQVINWTMQDGVGAPISPRP
jgi:hypothetical protein